MRDSAASYIKCSCDWCMVSRYRSSKQPGLPKILATVFLWSDAAATIYFAARFAWLLFEGGVYFFGKPWDVNDTWISYVQLRQWWLLDAVSSMHSLSVLLSAVGTTHTTQTVLSTIVVTVVISHSHTCAQFEGGAYFVQKLRIVLLLFEGGH